MEIHRFEKLWGLVSVLLIVGFITTIAYGAVFVGVEMVDASGGQIQADELNQHPQFSGPGVYQTGPNSYDVYIVAEQFQFRPGTQSPLRLPADSEITFYVTSADVTHGFNVVGTNVNTMAIPGQIAKLPVTFNEPGTYGIVCHEYCGAAHHEMAGSIVVVPPSQYDGPSGNTSVVAAPGDLGAVGVGK
jgi:cytochrome c oxidase subunit 2